MQKGYSSLYITLAVVILATALLQVINDHLNGIFSYHRAGFFKYFYYQWLTPSLVHYSWMHWLLNILNLLAIVFIFYRVWSAKRLLIVFTISSVFIIVSLYIFDPDINSYVGMSGVLYTLAIYGALKNLKYDRLVSILVLIYVVLKLFFDDTINHLMGVDIALLGLNVVHEVHWYGAVAGILMYLSCRVSE